MADGDGPEPLAGAPAIDLTLAGIPRWLLEEYLVELGGRPAGGGQVAGDGWSAELGQLPDRRLGSLRVGQVRLVVRGSAGAVERLRPALERKLLRAGG